PVDQEGESEGSVGQANREKGLMTEREAEVSEATDTAESIDGAAADAEPATEAPAKPKRKKVPAKARAKDADPLEVPLFDSAGALQGEVRLPKVIFAEKVNTP